MSGALPGRDSGQSTYSEISVKPTNPRERVQSLVVSILTLTITLLVLGWHGRLLGGLVANDDARIVVWRHALPQRAKSYAIVSIHRSGRTRSSMWKSY